MNTAARARIEADRARQARNSVNHPNSLRKFSFSYAFLNSIARDAFFARPKEWRAFRALPSARFRAARICMPPLRAQEGIRGLFLGHVFVRGSSSEAPRQTKTLPLLSFRRSHHPGSFYGWLILGHRHSAAIDVPSLSFFSDARSLPYKPARAHRAHKTDVARPR